MKVVRTFAILLGVYLLLGLSLDAAIGYFQPQRQGTVVLRTFDSSGGSKDTVLGLRDDNGQVGGTWRAGGVLPKAPTMRRMATPSAASHSTHRRRRRRDRWRSLPWRN